MLLVKQKRDKAIVKKYFSFNHILNFILCNKKNPYKILF
jgi:hypothetical protein